uniref:C-myc promoter-binding protein-like isoform X2 n=1 Tax=Petromyzon marinus TaxID=7757 RepID=A0AAJ7TXV7_PETMA|nr:C-myc promoter-binding protein-like isoform X2 [Petromyzon marinus]
MEEKGPRVADYFVVAGLTEESKPLEEDMAFAEGRQKAVRRRDPITDVAVVCRSQGEEPPQGYTCIEATPTNLDADLNHGSLSSPQLYLCYRRGRDKPPLTDLGVLYEWKERLMQGCETIRTTPYGRPANVNNSAQHIYVTYRRAHESASQNALAVTDICIIVASKGETPPHTFCKVNKNLNSGMWGASVFLCYKKSVVRANSIAYKAGQLSRYPTEDYETFPLPEPVPMFCLPMGAVIECWPPKTKCPAPIFSTFILTSVSGDKVYGAAVQFYEPYPAERLSEKQGVQLGLRSKVDRRPLPGPPFSVNANKCICLLSRWPFFDAFRKFLLFVYRLSFSGPHALPIEKHISHFMFHVPFPSSQRPRILVQLSMQDSLVLSQPIASPLPLSGASFCTLLQNLGPENAATLLLFALTENKILIHSLRPAVLTSAAEALNAMIFPFHWQCPYIPLCPLSLADMLSAPCPFIVGVDSRYFDLYEPPPDVVSVDLDTNTISQTEERKSLNWRLLPKKPCKNLMNTLTNLHQQIVAMNHRSMEDPVLESGIFDLDFKRRARQQQLEMEIQEAFLRFMASILKGYRTYLRPITQAPSEKATDARSLFDLQGFLKSRDRAYNKFYSQMMRTQMFIRFIEECSFVTDKDASLAFFDDCVEKLFTSDKGAERDFMVDVEKADDVRLIELDESYRSEHTVFITPPEPPAGPGPDTLKPAYKYSGFPVLNRSLFEMPLGLLKVPQGCTKNSCPNSPAPALARRTKQEIKSAQKQARKCSAMPQMWAKCLLGHCYSLWFICLPSYVRVTHPKSRALRTAYDVLLRMQAHKLEPPDEVCYRVLMQLCGLYGHPVLAVKVLFEMKKMGVQPNAITYGFYNKAVLESTWPSGNRGGYFLWTKVRNVLHGVVQFRQTLRKRLPSTADGSDAGSHGSLESGADAHGSEHVPSTNELAHVGSAEDVSSTGGHSDQGYNSLSKEDAQKGEALLSMASRLSGAAPGGLRTGEVLRESDSSSMSDGDSRQGSRDQLPQADASDGTDAAGDHADLEHKRPSFHSVRSIVKMSCGSFDNSGSMGDVMGGAGSTAGLLFTSQGSYDEPSFLDGPLPASAGSGGGGGGSGGGSGKASAGRRRQRSVHDGTAPPPLQRQRTLAERSCVLGGRPGLDDAMPAGFMGADERILTAAMRAEGRVDGGGAGVEANAASTDNLGSQHFTTEKQPRPHLEKSDSADIFSLDDLDSEPVKVVGPSKSQQGTKTSPPPPPLPQALSPQKPQARVSSAPLLLTKDAGGGDCVDDLEAKPGSLLPVSTRPAERKSVVAGFDPLSLLVAETEDVKSLDSSGSVQSLVPSVPRNLAEEIETYMTSTAEVGRSPSVEPKRGVRATRLERRLSLPSRSPQRGVPRSLTFPNPQPEAEPNTDRALVSQSWASSQLLTGPRMDVLKSSVKLAATGVVGVASKWYNKLASSYSEHGVDPATGLPHSEASPSDYGAAENERRVDVGFGMAAAPRPWGGTPGLATTLAGEEHGSPDEMPGAVAASSFHIDSLPVAGTGGAAQRRAESPSARHNNSSSSSSNIFQNFAMEVLISSCSRCRACESLVYDEEVMAGWMADDSNLNTTCPFCGSTFVPFLNIEIRDMRGPGRNCLKPSSSMESVQGVGTAGFHEAPLSHGRPPPRAAVATAIDPLITLTVTPSQDSSPAPEHGKAPARRVESVPLSVPIPRSASARTPLADITGPGLRAPLGTSTMTGSLPNNLNGSLECLSIEGRASNPEPVSVPYLSPLVLRKELESLLENEGEQVVSSPPFVDQHPILFWNLVWYFRRLGLPSSLPGLVLASEHCNRGTQVPRKLLSQDSKLVLVQMLWDNLKLHQDPGQPMYIHWNAQSLNCTLMSEREQSSLVHALVTDEQQLPRGTLQSIVTSIQHNDLYRPLSHVLEMQAKHPAHRRHRHRSLYREILFLSMVSLGRDNVDIDAFDREYKRAYDRLEPHQVKLTHNCDRPPSARVSMCRRTIGEPHL